jgi:hypothetical protein
MQGGTRTRLQAGTAIALSALLAMALCLGAAGAALGSSADAPAEAAKKKACKKKKGKKGTASAKKKKGCKKKKKKQATGPTVRASMTWDTLDDIDLHVFDASGNHSGARVTGPSDSIPGTTHSYEVSSPGPETFTDSVSPSTRPLTIYACFETMVILASPINVSTRVTDPGGAVRVTQVAVSPADPWKQAAVSPAAGTAFVPANPGDYCLNAGP